MSVDLWIMAGEEAERDAAAHKLALARVACACYWPVLASADTKDGYEHAKALISEGVTTSVASVAVSPADQAILASRVLDSFDEDWDAHQAARTAVVEDAPGYAEQHPFGIPAQPLENEAPELENEIASWEGADREQRVNMGNGIGVSDDSAGPNVEGPGQNQGEDPLLHASALDIEAGLVPGDYRLDAFGALILVQPVQAVRHTAPGGGEHAPYYIREEGGKFKVVNRNGEVKGTHDSKESARQQQKALYVNVPGATEEAEKRHGHTPKAVSEEGKKATRHIARELRCTKCGQEVTPKDTKGNYGSCPEGGDHNPEWGPDKEASLQMTALQRQAVQVARNLVDQMPAGVQHHAVAKAMYMRAKGFDLTQDETDLVINAALRRVTERLDFTKEADITGYPPGYMEQPHMRAHPEIRRMLDRVHVGTPDNEVADIGAQWARNHGAHPGEAIHDQAISDALAVHHHNQDEYADVMNHSTWPRGQAAPVSDPNQQRLFSKRHTADVSEEKRDRAESAGDTLPGTDKFPITNRTDLENAKHDIGRTTEPHDKVVNYINRKADELGAPKVGEEKTSRLTRLWAKLTGRTAQGDMTNPMDPSSGGNPFSPAQDVNSAMTDQNPTMGAGAGAGGAMSPNTAPPDEIPGQTQPGSATGTAASSKPRTKPSENPNAPNPPPQAQPQGMPMQMLTGTPMMAARARVAIADTILDNNPGMGDDEALHLAGKTIERYPHLVREAYGGSDYPFDSATGGYNVCSQCGVEAFDSRTGHCHNCGFVAGGGGIGFDPLVGPTTIRPGRVDLRNPGIR